MKWGLIASGVLIVLIAVVTVIAMRGNAERSTTATSKQMLAVRDFKGQPAVVEFAGGDASAAFQDIVKFYEDNASILDGERIPAELSEQAIDVMIKFHQAGTVSGSFLDKTTPTVPHGTPSFGTAVQMVGLAASKRAGELHGRNDTAAKERAVKAAKAVWAIGQNMFEKATRFPIRQQGLETMKTAGNEMFNWEDEGNLSDAVGKWSEAILNYENNFLKYKLDIVYGLSPNVGDLLNIAYEDQDISFRVEAVLAMGWVKYNPRTRGNVLDIGRAALSFWRVPPESVPTRRSIALARPNRSTNSRSAGVPGGRRPRSRERISAGVRWSGNRAAWGMYPTRLR